MSEDGLRQLHKDLWVAERSQRFLGIEIGTRMTAVRLEGGGVWLHSPVPLDARTRLDLGELGPIRCVVAPNRFHHLSVGQWAEAYPEAQLFAAPGLPEKRKDLAFHAALANEPPAAWRGQIDQLLMRSMPAAGEVVFLHRASRTLILTDLVFNVREADSLGLRIFVWLNNARGFGPSRVAKLMMRDRKAGRAEIDRILGWDFDRITLTHGEVVETGAKELLRAAFAWL